AGTTALAHPLNQAKQRWRSFDLPIGYRIADPRQILHHDATGANIEMADLGIAHLPLRQTYIATGRTHEDMRGGIPQTIEGRGARETDRVVARAFSPAPSIQHYKHHRTTFLHFRLS